MNITIGEHVHSHMFITVGEHVFVSYNKVLWKTTK